MTHITIEEKGEWASDAFEDAPDQQQLLMLLLTVADCCYHSGWLFCKRWHVICGSAGHRYDLLVDYKHYIVHCCMDASRAIRYVLQTHAYLLLLPDVLKRTCSCRKSTCSAEGRRARMQSFCTCLCCAPLRFVGALAESCSTDEAAYFTVYELRTVCRSVTTVGIEYNPISIGRNLR